MLLDQEVGQQGRHVLPQDPPVRVPEDLKHRFGSVEDDSKAALLHRRLNRAGVLVEEVLGKERRLAKLLFFDLPAQILDVLLDLAQVVVFEGHPFEVEVKQAVEGRTPVVFGPLLFLDVLNLDQVLKLLLGHFPDFLHTADFFHERIPFPVLDLNVVDDNVIQDIHVLLQPNGKANGNDIPVPVAMINPFLYLVFQGHRQQRLKVTHLLSFLEHLNLLMHFCVMLKYMEFEAVNVEHYQMVVGIDFLQLFYHLENVMFQERL